LKKLAVLLALVATSVFFSQLAMAHCEIPCGIYDDQMRIDMIKENITTIEKSMKQITALSAESPVNYNQLVRWIGNKENHATELQEIVQQYFMTQRIKPAHDKDGKASAAYVEQLTLLHMMLVHAMKAKQTTDLEEVATLRTLTDQFSKAYFGDKK
jgi:nickel superoxide dismutase